VQLGAVAELGEHGSQLAEIGERIARALEEEHRQIHLAQVRGARAAGAPDAWSGKPKNAIPRTSGSARWDAAVDVMRPPSDLPPANSGSSGAALAAASIAARTVA
jgi:hypothetical protein